MEWRQIYPIGERMKVSDRMKEKTDGIERETDGMEGKTDRIEGETNGERLTIVCIEYVMETTSAILNTSSSNGTVAPRRSFQRYSGLK